MLRTELIRTVPDLLTGHARHRPDKVAFVDDQRSVTYGELVGTTARLAGTCKTLVGTCKTEVSIRATGF